MDNHGAGPAHWLHLKSKASTWPATVRELQAMAIMADKLGKRADKRMFEEHAVQLGKLINKPFWDETDAFITTVMKEERAVRVKSVAGFMPCGLGRHTGSRQAPRAGTPAQRKGFWTAYPVAAMPRPNPITTGHGCPRVQLARVTWAGNYMIFHGLLNYGFKDRTGAGGPVVPHGTGRESGHARVLQCGNGRRTGADAVLGVFGPVLCYALGIPTELQPDDLNRKIQPFVRQQLGIHSPLPHRQCQGLVLARIRISSNRIG